MKRGRSVTLDGVTFYDIRSYKEIVRTQHYVIYLVVLKNEKKLIKIDENRYQILLDRLDSIKTNKYNAIVKIGKEIKLYSLDFTKELAVNIQYEFKGQGFVVYSYIKNNEKIYFEFGDKTLRMCSIPLNNSTLKPIIKLI